MVKAASDDFQYLRQPAIRFGQSWRWWACGNRVEQSPAAMAELAAAHDAICRREDAWALGQWLMQSAARRKALSGSAAVEAIDEAEFKRGLRGLLRLIHALGRRGVKPFDASLLQCSVSRSRRAGRTVDSNAIPVAFRRLAHLAQRIGIRPGHRALRQFVDDVTPGQFNRLARIAHALRRRVQRQPEQWQAQRSRLSANAPGMEAMLCALMHTLDALDIF